MYQWNLKQKYRSGEIQTYKQEHAWIPCYIYNVLDFSLVKECKNLKEASDYLDCYKSAYIGTMTTGIIKEKYCIIIKSELNKSNLSIKDYIRKNYLKCISSNGIYLISEDSNGILTYHRTIKGCADSLNISSSIILKHGNATKENPYKPNKTKSIIYYSNEFFPQDGAVYREESDKELRTEIGEDCDVNPEVIVKPKEFTAP